MFSQGKIVQDRYRISQVLDCFLESCSCRDRQAHCYTVIDDPLSDLVDDMDMSYSITFAPKPKMKKDIEIDRYIFPCKHLSTWFSFQRDHPSRLEDQIQAAGVKHACSICPNFSPDDFRKVGSRTVLRGDSD